MAITLDLTNYKESTSDRLPEGIYRFRIRDTEETKAKKSNNPMINMWLEVIDHEPEDGEESLNGATVIDRLVFQENAHWRIVTFLKVLGMKPNIKGKQKISGRSFEGKTLLAKVVDDDPFRGKIKSTVAEYFPDPKAGTGTGSAPAAELPEIDDNDNGPAGDDLPEGPEGSSEDDAQKQADAIAQRVDGTAILSVDDVDL